MTLDTLLHSLRIYLDPRWFSLTDKLWGWFWRLLLGIAKWIRYGGFHRVLVFVCIVMGFITLAWLWEQFKKWWRRVE